VEFEFWYMFWVVFYYPKKLITRKQIILRLYTMVFSEFRGCFLVSRVVKLKCGIATVVAGIEVGIFLKPGRKLHG